MTLPARRCSSCRVVKPASAYADADELARVKLCASCKEHGPPPPRRPTVARYSGRPSSLVDVLDD